MGYRSVEECQEAISSSEFNGWLAYDRINPLVPNWKELFGTVAATIINVNRSKRGAKVYQWYDIFPSERPQRVQSPSEQLAVAEMWNEYFGGLDLRKKPPTA